MKAIRIEHANGVGMFRFHNDFKTKRQIKIDIALDSMYERMSAQLPSPHDDGICMHLQCKNWFCAFSSIESLLEWVYHEELVLLVRFGLRVYEIEVNEFQLGAYQIAYTKESIKSKTDITNKLI